MVEGVGSSSAEAGPKESARAVNRDGAASFMVGAGRFPLVQYLFLLSNLRSRVHLWRFRGNCVDGSKLWAVLTFWDRVGDGHAVNESNVYFTQRTRNFISYGHCKLAFS